MSRTKIAHEPFIEVGINLSQDLPFRGITCARQVGHGMMHPTSKLILLRCWSPEPASKDTANDRSIMFPYQNVSQCRYRATGAQPARLVGLS